MDVSELLNMDELKEQVIQEVADRVYEEIHDDVKYEVKSRISKTIDATVSTTVSKLAQEVLGDKYQPIDDYGDPQGEPTTLREMFKKACVKWWEQKVDKNGKAERYGGKLRYLWVAEKAVSNVLTLQLSRQMGQLVDATKEQVKKGVAEVIAERVAKVFGN